MFGHAVVNYCNRLWWHPCCSVSAFKKAADSYHMRKCQRIPLDSVHKIPGPLPEQIALTLKPLQQQSESNVVKAVNNRTVLKAQSADCSDPNAVRLPRKDYIRLDVLTHRPRCRLISAKSDRSHQLPGDILRRY